MRTRPAEVVRFYPELRSVHIERLASMKPSEVMYLTTKYDLAGTRIDARCSKVTVAGALRRFLTTSAATFEVSEPLWLRMWPRHVTLVVGFRLAGLLRRRPHRVVTYAMENNALDVLVGGGHAVPRIVSRFVGLVVGATARLTIDRVAFASPAAASTYLRLPAVRGIEHQTFLELPAAASVERPANVVSQSVVFLGLVDDRKGIRVLMTAWESVEAAHPAAVLTIVGGGPLIHEVEGWASLRPASRRATGELPHADTGEYLAAASVLVAPSLPEGRWREQIGLPIKEGLSHGLTVVTTRQTALAEWLERHGHGVVDPAPSSDAARDLAMAIDRAVTRPLERSGVRRSLPERDSRLDADDWLSS